MRLGHVYKISINAYSVHWGLAQIFKVAGCKVGGSCPGKFLGAALNADSETSQLEVHNM